MIRPLLELRAEISEMFSFFFGRIEDHNLLLRFSDILYFSSMK